MSYTVITFHTRQFNLLPWSAHVTPTLKGLTACQGYSYASLDVISLKSRDTWISMPLADKLQKVFDNANVQLSRAIAEQAMQDPRVASQVERQNTPFFYFLLLSLTFFKFNILSFTKLTIYADTCAIRGAARWSARKF